MSFERVSKIKKLDFESAQDEFAEWDRRKDRNYMICMVVGFVGGVAVAWLLFA